MFGQIVSFIERRKIKKAYSHSYMTMDKRYRELRQSVQDSPIIDKIMIDEEFIPPHKSAAFTPYDCVLCVTPNYNDIITSGEASVDSSEVSQDVEGLIEDVKYDRIVATNINETSEPGEFLVYVSLETFEEYKSRW